MVGSIVASCDSHRRRAARHADCCCRSRWLAALRDSNGRMRLSLSEEYYVCFICMSIRRSCCVYHCDRGDTAAWGWGTV